jgi:WD40 repeat protein
MGAVNTVVFNGDGRRLVVGSGDGGHWSGEATVWEVASGKRILSLPHEGIFVSAAFTPDGQRLATISMTTRFVSEIKIWDATTGEALLTLSEHPVFGDSNGTRDNSGPGKLFFSPDGHRLLALNADGTLSIWNATPWSAPVSAK